MLTNWQFTFPLFSDSLISVSIGKTNAKEQK